MGDRRLPHAAAVFCRRFIFTTLNERNVRSHVSRPFVHPKTRVPITLVCLDDMLHYTPFAYEYGPYNLSYVVEACEELDNQFARSSGSPICLYTDLTPEKKASVLLLAAIYVMTRRESAEPWGVYAAMGHMEVMPFRDAGRGPNEHGVSILDCLYGLHKAMSLGLIDLHCISTKWYRYFEQPSHGDLNILGDFIAFASPEEAAYMQRHNAYLKAMQEGMQFEWYDIPKSSNIKTSFHETLEVFAEENVGLVVRLNEVLYDKEHFTDGGHIDHVDLPFDDGSDPSDKIVRYFIDLAEEYIEKRKRKVAVHCRAGLGRTGALIGAYLIYKYHFSAPEAIAFMRIVRPGMVVGGQQPWMLQNQTKWVSWAACDAVNRELLASQEASQSANPLATPPADADPPSPLSSVKQLPQTRTKGEMIEDILGSLLDTDGPSLPPKTIPVDTFYAGDAVGQPRKATLRTLKTASQTVIPEIKVRESACKTSVPPLSLGTSLSTPSTPMINRGVKRGSTRLPRPSSQTTGTSSSSSWLAVPTNLQRSSSLASMASSATSEARKPQRKRPALAATVSLPATIVLSSPPPSRETSPLSDDGIKVIDRPISFSFGGAANRLRKKQPEMLFSKPRSLGRSASPPSAESKENVAVSERDGTASGKMLSKSPTSGETENQVRKPFSPPRIFHFGNK